MAYDYYSEAESIAGELACQSHMALATSLRNDISEGSTATEILMRLRDDLRPVVTSETVTLATRSRIQELLDRIDVALAP